jgi:predicted Rossmann fold flavoprotein
VAARAYADVAIVGAGAAGLMAAIAAGRRQRGRRIVCLDGAAHLGKKILISGGGRCNVTHDVVDTEAFAGSSPNSIRKVLRRFDVAATISFFRELGVELVREPGGKLFPTSNRAATVLNALLGAARAAGVELCHPWRVETIVAEGDGFRLAGPSGLLTAAKVVLATGGRSVPQTGSDGHGYGLARGFAHTVTRVFPALVPLLLPRDHPLTQLAGLTTDATLEVRGATGKRLCALSGSLLCTHRGLSGPVVLDISRHWLAFRQDDANVGLYANWLPGETVESLDDLLKTPGAAGAMRRLQGRLPERLARLLCDVAAVDPALPAGALPRPLRRALVAALTALPLPITGDRGFAHAEVTAGGVPLTEIRLATMESRLRPGLHLCGEICDVDGRIGGYNFQWAWSSGYVAGISV